MCKVVGNLSSVNKNSLLKGARASLAILREIVTANNLIIGYLHGPTIRMNLMLLFGFDSAYSKRNYSRRSSIN